MADPPTLPPMSNKSYLTAPAYPSTEVFYHAYLPSDHRDLVVFKNDEPCCNTDDIRFNYYGGWASLFAQVDKFRNFPGSLNQYKAELSTIYPWVSELLEFWKLRKSHFVSVFKNIAFKMLFIQL
ncbi:hypothetical protein B9Z55_017346 [Caenorhabditis nigoni]|uniref:Uncharacterized protein n=1 Tax=Caenorhabditis nigoni TaxID=1611254 RepID=A0A2G5T9J3_9PELO|nr:hypothetical protein B9Z55_017346 [Caenorhabditis nigoni]